MERGTLVSRLFPQEFLVLSPMNIYLRCTRGFRPAHANMYNSMCTEFRRGVHSFQRVTVCGHPRHDTPQKFERTEKGGRYGLLTDTRGQNADQCARQTWHSTARRPRTYERNTSTGSRHLNDQS